MYPSLVDLMSLTKRLHLDYLYLEVVSRDIRSRKALPWARVATARNIKWRGGCGNKMGKGKNFRYFPHHTRP